MAKPINYYYLAAEFCLWDDRKLRLMRGQHPYGTITVSYEHKVKEYNVPLNEVSLLFYGTLTDKENGFPYVYAHKNIWPIVVPKQFAKILIDTKLVGFIKSAKNHNEIYITRQELKDWFLTTRGLYTYHVDKEREDNFSKRETVEGTLLDNCYDRMERVINFLCNMVEEPVSLTTAAILHQELGHYRLAMQVAKDQVRTLVTAFKTASPNKTVKELLDADLWDLDV